jgi:arsenate reductase
VGWETLINRKGTAWRGLDEATKAAVVDAASARAVAVATPSVIKRPVVEWVDGSVSVGFERFDACPEIGADTCRPGPKIRRFRR